MCMKIKFWHIALVFVFVIAGILFVNNQALKSILYSPFCNDLKIQIDNMIIEANYCDVDSDCVSPTLRKSFSCSCKGNLVNKDADLTVLRNKIDTSIDRCSHLIPLCTPCPPFRQIEIVCKNNKCLSRYE